jgi:hypothetical protein
MSTKNLDGQGWAQMCMLMMIIIHKRQCASVQLLGKPLQKHNLDTLCIGFADHHSKRSDCT